MKLTQARLHELLHYDPQTGVLTWKVSRRGVTTAGQVAGSVNKGRLLVSVDNHLYIGSRLIWLWVTGRWPNGEVDHKDRNPLNNRWLNLRDVTQRVNAQNHPKQANNKSGVTGVSWHKASQKWRAHLALDGKSIHLGLFAEFAGAVAARKVAEKQYFQGGK